MGEQVEKMKKKVKKGVKQALAIWKIIITIILIALLIPLFLKNGWNSRFYFWIIAPSIILYIIIAYLQMKVLKGKMRKYVELTGTWLFGGILTLSATFIVMMLGYTIWAHALLIGAAIIYALFLQRLGLLRWLFL
jgi:predicted permease